MCGEFMRKLASWVGAAVITLSPALASDGIRHIPDLYSISAENYRRSGDLFLRGRLRSWENQPDVREYRRAIARFPDARSCFPSRISDNVSPNTLDAREFDWNAMRTQADAEVCIFRIAIALSSPDKVEAWLRYFSFAVNRFEEPNRPIIPNVEYGGGRGFVISGRQSLHNSRLLYRGPRFFYKGWWFGYLIRSIFVYEQGIIIIYDNTGSVVGASIYESIL